MKCPCPDLYRSLLLLLQLLSLLLTVSRPALRSEIEVLRQSGAPATTEDTPGRCPPSPAELNTLPTLMLPLLLGVRPLPLLLLSA
jgi:hypothetical protein